MRSHALSWVILVSTVTATAILLLKFPPASFAFDSEANSGSGQDNQQVGSAERNELEWKMLDGIFYGVSRGLVAGAMGMDFGVSSVYVTFYPDGRVYRRVPEGGLEGWDRDNAERAVPGLWGRYRPSGADEWDVVWNESNAAATVVREGDGLLYEGGIVLPVATCEDLILHATYAQPNYLDAADPYFIAFNDEGEFLDWNLIGAIAYQNLNSYDSRTIVGGAGHYRIGKNTLYLDYSNGQRVPVEIHVRPDDIDLRPIPAIYINGWELVQVSERR